jgi:multidrug efflux pump subunit AcrA (membrane-fusion protein)
LLAPQLWDRYNNDRWLITKAGISTRDTAKMLMGPKHMLAKTVAALVIAALLVVCNIPHKLYPQSWPGSAWLDMRPMYRVSAPFTFVPTERRSLCVPFEGTMERLAVVDGVVMKPGTVVKKDQPLAYMRSDDLVLERVRALSDEAKSNAMAVKYERDNDRSNDADGAAARAEAKAHAARAAELQLRIDQATIRSPIDGVILSGDNEDKQGAKFEMGKVIFEIGEVDALKAEINVNERDLQLVQAGPGVGQLATRSLPNDKFDFTVERIVPMGDVKEGSNTFRVYGKVSKIDPNWRPGMVGEARLDVEKRTWAWIWTHRLVDWVRLKLWM